MPEHDTIIEVLGSIKTQIEALAAFNDVLITPFVELEEYEKTGGFPACFISHESRQRESYAGKRWNCSCSITVCVSLPTSQAMTDAETRVMELMDSIEDALDGLTDFALSLVEDGGAQSQVIRAGRAYVFLQTVWRFTIRR